MTQNYLAQTVLEAAIERLNFVFDNCDDIVVSVSGGKDSTVLANLALRVARERGRLPLKLFWLDQEAEWQATGDYMAWLMRQPWARPFWYQIPFRLTNSLSFQDNYLYCWRAQDRELWLREPDPIAIKVNPLPQYDRFHDLISHLPAASDCAAKKHVGVLVGLRIAESPARRATATESAAKYKGITWCHKTLYGGNSRVFWPLYDWQDSDIWTAIAQGGGTGTSWRYNTVYDQFFKYGFKGRQMRVSALIHETAWHAIELLQEVEPRLYDRYLRRVAGTSTFSHFKGDAMPRELPPVFASWRQYRDYLLANLIQPQYHALFRRRWQKQAGEDWAKVHVREIMVNDIDGTINANYRTAAAVKDGAKGRYRERRAERFARWLAESGTAT